jgi:hypothetical protein
MIDVTGHLPVDDALQASEERYRLLFKRNLAGMQRTGMDGRVREVRDAVTRILGFASRGNVCNRRSTGATAGPIAGDAGEPIDGALSDRRRALPSP